MSFKFNFTNPDLAFEEEQNQVTDDRREDNIPKNDATEINPKFSGEMAKKLAHEVCEVDLGTRKIKHLSASAALKYLREHDSHWKSLFAAEESHSDLVPGVYEGGLKIWECSLDLARFLVKNESITPGSFVLELGCGAALPGVIAYLSGAHVTFQDYNEEVLNSVTIANIVLNTSEADRPKISQRCRFIAGDWENIQHKYYGQDSSNSPLYDVILTSETIYAKENHKKLLEFMKHALHPTGVIYLAAKSFYFGVGGGITDFVKMISDDGVLEPFQSFDVTGGVGIGRYIYGIKFKNT